LGAWGCGAYGNPVGEIARAWKKVLSGEEKKKRTGKARSSESWDGIEDVVFAIRERRMALEFARHFGGDLVVEEGEHEGINGTDAGSEEASRAAEELESKIAELEGQITQVRSPHLKTGLESVLEGLKKQLADKKGSVDASDDEREDDEANPSQVGEEMSTASRTAPADEDREDTDSGSDSGSGEDDIGITSDHDEGPEFLPSRVAALKLDSELKT